MVNILVVEDNIENLELVVYLLEMKGYDFKVARDGEKALKLANKYSFNLILLDIQLPEIDGFEVLKRLKNTLNSNTPVIAVTACAMKGDEKILREKGCVDYLAKPFSINEFFEVVSFYILG